MSIRRVIALMATSVMLPGCISYSSMQSADTLHPGKMSVYFAAAGQALSHTTPSSASGDANNAGSGSTSTNASTNTASTNTSSTNTTSPSTSSVGANGIYFYEMGLRFGVVRDIDFGMRMLLEPGIGSYLADVKVQLAKSPFWSISTGAGVSYMALAAPINQDTASLSLFEVHLPLYTTVRLARYLDLGMTPRVIFRQVASFGGYAMAGGSAGLFIGRTNRVTVEYSQFRNMSSGIIVRQLTAGLIIGYPNYNAQASTKEHL